MLNANKLRAKIVEKNLSIADISQKIGKDKTTFYRKMSNNTFTLKEVDSIAGLLGLTAEEATDIFFAQ